MIKYHRLVRESPDYAAWRLPVAVLLAIAIYLPTLVLLNALIAIRTQHQQVVGDGATRASALSFGDPVALVLEFAVFAVLVPVVLISVRLVWPEQVKFLHSVQGRFRWGWFGKCVLAAVAVAGGVVGVVIILISATAAKVAFVLPTGIALWSLLVVLVMVPCQAAGEEYVFRGVLLQLFGSWSRRAALPVVVTTLLFIGLHSYDVWGLVAVFFSGLAMALITLRTGGLEAAIAIHVLNNIVWMGLGLFGATAAGGAVNGLLTQVLPTVAIYFVFWAVIEVMLRRYNLPTERPALAATDQLSGTDNRF